MVIPPVSATPLTMIVEPSLNATVPVGVPPDPVTVAVTFTGWPMSEGFSELVSVVCVDFSEAAFTVCVVADDVLVKKLEMPSLLPYLPVMECLPADNDDVVKLAVPPAEKKAETKDAPKADTKAEPNKEEAKKEEDKK